LKAIDIISFFGLPRVLHIGCGNGELVQDLLANGLEAFGIDPDASIIEHARSKCGERVSVGSGLDTEIEKYNASLVLVSEDISALPVVALNTYFSRLLRAARGSVYLRVKHVPAGSDSPERDRVWWERLVIAAGFRKHPRLFRAIPYNQIEAEVSSFTIGRGARPPHGYVARGRSSI
jgi:SAM-dependent methyltransferase